MQIVYMVVAIVVILIAHLFRITRWKLFVEIYECPKKKSLIQALSIGYLVNYAIPYKLGDLVRAHIAGKKMRNGRAFGLSTVIIDRYLDVLSVGVIFVILSVGDFGKTATYKSEATFYIVAAVLFLALTSIVYLFRSFGKRFIKLVAGIFNARIEAAILRVAWAIIWNFKDIFWKINKLKMLLTTVAMWSCYLLSYYYFSAFLSSCGMESTWKDIFLLLFAQNNITINTGNIFLLGNAYNAQSFYMLIYTIIPLVILMIISVLMKEDVNEENSGSEYLNLFPHMEPKERLEFLENYFSDNNKEYVANYFKITQGVLILRDYSAGSNATTMLCLGGNDTFFRKYALGRDGERLREQCDWLEKYNSLLPLPAILKREDTDIYCYYDMPYNNGAVGLFEYMHSMPMEKSWNMIQNILETLESTLYRTEVRKADSETIKKYIATKVTQNLGKIKSSKKLQEISQYDTIIINGIEYKNLPHYERYLTEAYLQEIFKDDVYAVIHGDLTVENIICNRDVDGEDRFYIIDPNTGNIHESPNLDYGKLLQSIHGGYEFLMSANQVKVSENKIDFFFVKSSVSIELHKKLDEYLRQKFGEEKLKSIYFHEMIHWLRLMPYKLAKNDKKELIFYAGMIMVFNDVMKMFESEEGR